MAQPQSSPHRVALMGKTTAAPALGPVLEEAHQQSVIGVGAKKALEKVFSPSPRNTPAFTAVWHAFCILKNKKPYRSST